MPSPSSSRHALVTGVDNSDPVDVVVRLSAKAGGPQTWASLETARRLLGYAPATSLEAGRDAFAAWLRPQLDLAPSAA